MELAQATSALDVRARWKFSGSPLAPMYDLGATIIVILLASYVAWDDWRIWNQPAVFGQVGATTLALLTGKWLLLRGSYRTPTNRMAVSVLWLGITFAGLLSWILFTRSYYSRSFLLVSLALLFAWQVVDALVVRARSQPLRLAGVPSDLVTQLAATTDLDITMLSDPKVNSVFDGIVVDMHDDLSGEWTRFVAESTA